MDPLIPDDVLYLVLLGNAELAQVWVQTGVGTALPLHPALTRHLRGDHPSSLVSLGWPHVSDTTVGRDKRLLFLIGKGKQ